MGQKNQRWLSEVINDAEDLINIAMQRDPTSIGGYNGEYGVARFQYGQIKGDAAYFFNNPLWPDIIEYFKKKWKSDFTVQYLIVEGGEYVRYIVDSSRVKENITNEIIDIIEKGYGIEIELHFTVKIYDEDEYNAIVKRFL